MIDESKEKLHDFAGKFGVTELLRRAKAKHDIDDPLVAPAVPAAEPAREPEPPEGEVPGLESLTPLPKPGDAYKAHARPSSRGVATLFVVRADGSVRGFPYGDLYGPDLVPDGEAGKGWSIVMRFARFEQVTLTGRNLDVMHSYLGHHRVAWVRELAKGKPSSDQQAATITDVSIVAIER